MHFLQQEIHIMVKVNNDSYRVFMFIFLWRIKMGGRKVEFVQKFAKTKHKKNNKASTKQKHEQKKKILKIKNKKQKPIKSLNKMKGRKKKMDLKNKIEHIFVT